MSQIAKPVAQLLRSKNFAYLSTLMKDGSPQVTPTWVDHDDDGKNVLMNTAEGRIKEKNVSRDPISISDQNNPYGMVTIRGTVTEQIKEGADEHADRLAKKYMGLVSLPFTRRKESHFKDKTRNDIPSTATSITTG
jgi:PPOX class probable F420-dependent enzyme